MGEGFQLAAVFHSSEAVFCFKNANLGAPGLLSRLGTRPLISAQDTTSGL